jgi:Uma2 family endonuclease
MPGVKAELIQGVVYMSSPVSMEYHGSPHALLIAWMVHYQAFTPGVEVGDNATVRDIDEVSEPQPDGLLRIRPEFGGQSRTHAGYVQGAPELAAEIAASSASYDLHEKRDTFRQGGVREYVVWRVWDSAIDWFGLRGTDYQPLPLQPSGIIKSEVFPGLWLDAAALLRGDMARVLEVVQQGVASPEHAEFVKRLQEFDSRTTGTS